jgi:hypothetical protein
LVKAFVGLETPSGWNATFMEESAEKRAGHQQAVQQFTAQEILDAGAKARGEASVDDQSIFRERIYLDNTNPQILHD